MPMVVEGVSYSLSVCMSSPANLHSNSYFTLFYLSSQLKPSVLGNFLQRILIKIDTPTHFMLCMYYVSMLQILAFP